MPPPAVLLTGLCLPLLLQPPAPTYSSVLSSSSPSSHALALAVLVSNMWMDLGGLITSPMSTLTRRMSATAFALARVHLASPHSMATRFLVSTLPKLCNWLKSFILHVEDRVPPSSNRQPSPVIYPRVCRRRRCPKSTRSSPGSRSASSSASKSAASRGRLTVTLISARPLFASPLAARHSPPQTQHRIHGRGTLLAISLAAPLIFRRLPDGLPELLLAHRRDVADQPSPCFVCHRRCC